MAKEKSAQEEITLEKITLDEFVANKPKESRTFMGGFREYVRQKNIATATMKKFDELLIEFKSKKIE